MKVNLKQSFESPSTLHERFVDLEFERVLTGRQDVGK